MIILLFSVSSVLARVEDPLRVFLKESAYAETLSDLQIHWIREEIKLQSLIIKSIKTIRVSGGKFIDAEKASSITRDLILHTSLTRISDMEEMQKKALLETLHEIYRPENMNNNIKYIQKTFSDFIKWQKTTVSSSIRTQGLLYALVKFVAIQLDSTVPLLVTLSGNVAVGAGMFITPISPITLFPIKVLKDTYKNIVLVKSLGGIKAGYEHFKFLRHVRHKFNASIFENLDLINVHFAGKQYIIKLQHKSFLKNFLAHKRYAGTINIKAVRRFMKRYRTFDDVLSKMERSRLPDDLKLVKMITFIEHHPEPIYAKEFYFNFQKNIFKSSNLDIPKIHRQWAINIAHSKTFNQFYDFLLKVPNDIHPQVLDQLWRGYIYPIAAENIGDEFGAKSNNAFRKIENAYIKKLQPVFVQSQENLLTNHKKYLFIDSIFKAMSPVNPCQFIFKRQGGFK